MGKISLRLLKSFIIVIKLLNVSYILCNSGNIFQEGIYLIFALCKRYEEIPIYHNVSGRHAISNIDSEKIIYKRISEVPMKQAIWYPWKINFESWFWFRFATIFLHVIPGAIIDLVLMFQGKTPM
uniref:Uncharacterized protein n=1 Tax=Timema douglasi TaxID=61478 RepID=A0A7R8Z7S6_TIMDO|nr:unnamed protein product [Timema douglasi]